MLRGQVLEPGQRLRSSNGAYEMYMQHDGNLVLYHTGGPAIFASNTSAANARLVMQTDGNLVIYRPDGVALWATWTQGTAADHLLLHNDGNLILYAPNGTRHWQR